MKRNNRVGIVIPTLGQRPAFLRETINSARNFGDVFLVVVTPIKIPDISDAVIGVDLVIHEVEPGLAAAINWGFKNIPEDIQYIGWIGDDDLLTAGAGSMSVDFLRDNLDFVMTFGKCRYIDREGSLLGLNKVGQIAVPILRFGPDFIPQPGSVFRRETFNKVGQIDTSFKLAFDLELFIRFSKAGKIKYLGKEVGTFRWHSDSKSVVTRTISVIEASRARRMHLPLLLKPVSIFWELPVLLATYLAGYFVSRKSNS